MAFAMTSIACAVVSSPLRLDGAELMRLGPCDPDEQRSRQGPQLDRGRNGPGQDQPIVLASEEEAFPLGAGYIEGLPRIGCECARFLEVKAEAEALFRLFAAGLPRFLLEFFVDRK